MGKFGIVLPLLALEAVGGISFPYQATGEHVFINGKNYFSLKQVPVYRDKQRPIVYEQARMYWKYGQELPEELERALESETKQQQGAGQTSLTAIAPLDDSQFLIQAKVGKHTMGLSVDTGSSDL
jgi:hypothetical protein